MPITELQDYVSAWGFDWQIKEGFDRHSLRAIPKGVKDPRVHVVIPFKDQRQLTLATVASLKSQYGVKLVITAVDNNSRDRSLALELASQGVEVLTIQEPFNYSRLNNLAVRRSKLGETCEFLLFLNNDVELEPDTVLEMCRWAYQKGIGLVGSRLHYPDHTLQHGGVALNRSGPSNLLVWEHIEKGQPWHLVKKGKQICVVDAVTTACAMIRRNLFLDVGGFDEIWYPIAFSDTNLAQRLAERNLKCLYTPYASGIHHESVSRKSENIEDFESSRWLSEMLRAKRCKSDKFSSN